MIAMSHERHLLELPGTRWKVWRHALLRTTGFPASGLDRLRITAAAQAADKYLDGVTGRVEFDSSFKQAEAQGSAQVRAIASEPLFREAIAWQNPGIIAALDGVSGVIPGAPSNRKHRERERTIARYWQRYCAKTETIGFYGPVCWVTLDPSAGAVRSVPGPALLRERRVFLEYWAVTEYADRIAASLAVRRWLSPVLQPQLTLRGGQVWAPAKPPVPLSRAERCVVERLDGRKPAKDIAEEAVADAASDLRKVDDVYLLLDRLVQREIVRWDFNLPVNRECEQLLRAHMETVGDSEEKSRAIAGLDRLGAALRDVATVAANHVELPRAIARLDAEFTAITGIEPTRRSGQMYAARRIYFEEATRDVTVTIGESILKAIAKPLAVLMQAARWVSVALAAEYGRALRDIYDELSAEIGSAAVPLGEIWYLAQGLFYGASGRPADRVVAELARRWMELFQIGAVASEHEVRCGSDDLLVAVEQMFPACKPGWPDARLHSPDLQICAESIEAIERGDFSVVLGELHAAWATNACACAVAGHPAPGELAAALKADLGGGRIYPLLPSDWPRHSARTVFALDDADDVMLGILPAPGAVQERLLPVSSVTVSDADGVLVAEAADGRNWPLEAVFARLLSEVAVDVFKVAATGPHTPRIVIDSMVIARETWRTTVGECDLIANTKVAEAFLAARRWRRELGLPERVFVKLETEVKPLFVDFSGPLYVASFSHMLRAARTKVGNDAKLVITEMLPTPDQAWLTDVDGRGYLSELRLHIRDFEAA